MRNLARVLKIMTAALSAAMWLMGLAEQASGQVYPLWYEYVSQTCENGTCSVRRTTVMGSAVCIGRVNRGEPKWLYLTAAHNLTNGVPPRVWDGGSWVRARVLEVDTTMDVALLGIVSAREIPSASLATRPLADNEDCLFVAWLEAKRKVRAKTRVIRPVRRLVKGREPRWQDPFLFSVSHQAVPSNSGGGIIQDGVLYGVVFGDPGRAGLCTDASFIRAWMRSRRRGVYESVHVSASVAPAPASTSAPEAPAPPATSAPEAPALPATGCECAKSLIELRAKQGSLSKENAELKDRVKELSVQVGQLGRGFTVVFEPGDDPGEHGSEIEVKPGGKLVLPPVRLRLRTLDPDGNVVGETYTDAAPLGLPLQMKYQQQKDK